VIVPDVGVTVYGVEPKLSVAVAPCAIVVVSIGRDTGVLFVAIFAGPLKPTAVICSVAADAFKVFSVPVYAWTILISDPGTVATICGWARYVVP
jgi:hypothetical protein